MEESSWKTKINKIINSILDIENKATILVVITALTTSIFALYNKFYYLSKIFKNE